MVENKNTAMRECPEGETVSVPPSLEETFRIVKEEDLLGAVGDSVACRILVCLYEEAMTTDELVHRLALPRSTVYSKIHDLEEKGLVSVQAVATTRDGKAVNLFRSNLKAFSVSLKKGGLIVHVRYRNSSQTRRGVFGKRPHEASLT